MLKNPTHYSEGWKTKEKSQVLIQLFLYRLYLKATIIEEGKFPPMKCSCQKQKVKPKSRQIMSNLWPFYR